MKFVTIGGYHINLEQVACFCHYQDKVIIRFGQNSIAIPDPHGCQYRSLCDLTGTTPDEEVSK